MDHCVGPYVAGGYALGGHCRGSVYLTNTPYLDEVVAGIGRSGNSALRINTTFNSNGRIVTP